MFCPPCRSEYVEGVARCPECGADLVAQLPPAPAPPSGKVVTVFTTAERSLALLAKGLLESANIPYAARGDGLQDLFGWGRFGTGFNMVVGPVQFDVPEEYADEARTVLGRLDAGEGGEP